jgi:hypothetical protein
MAMEEEINDDEVNEKLEGISFVNRELSIKTNVTDKTEVIFQETSLPIVADRQRKLSPPGTSCPR